MTKKSSSALDLGIAKLASSGLIIDDADDLGIEILEGDAVRALNPAFRAVPALKINYYGIDKKPITDWPQGPPFYRLRYLDTPNDFAAIANPRGQRYTQPPDTVPVAYYPRTAAWEELAVDVTQPIVITEGELKAAKGCKEGFPTIGLGGVYNWRSQRMGVSWLPSLDLITWARRHVYICFDSDYRTNPQVCRALHEFGEALVQHGAFVYVVTLPALPDFEKTGLDDFLVGSGVTAVQQFRDLLGAAEPIGLSAPLWKLNERYIYAINPGMVIDQCTNQKISPSAFKEHTQSTLTYQERKLLGDGTVSYKPVSAAATWLKWPLRQEVVELVYEPGQKTFIPAGKLGARYNSWKGWGVEPKKGDVTPFLKLTSHLWTGAEPDFQTWMMQWFAYPLQHPGVKMFSSLVMHGIRHGTGKSLVGYTLGKIYGENFTEIGAADLQGNFNEWAENKQFVMGDDVAGSDRRQHADSLKKIITQPALRVNAKFISAYTIRDCINYLFTSNHPDALFLENDDRRFAILEVIVGPLLQQFYIEYGAWLNNGGAAALFYYLLNLNLKGFNPAAPAFRSEAKMRMIATTQSDLGAWCRQLVEAPDTILKSGGVVSKRDLYTSRELFVMYEQVASGGGRVTPGGLGRELARCGIRQVLGGKPVKLPDGSQGRYYAVRNAEKWLVATFSEITAHIAATTPSTGTARKSKY